MVCDCVNCDKNEHLIEIKENINQPHEKEKNPQF